MRERGHSLVSIVIGMALMGILASGAMALLKSNGRAARRIAARGSLTDLSRALDALFASAGCRNNGRSNYSASGVSPVKIVHAGGSYSLSADTLRFSTGAIAITTLPDAALADQLRPFTITDITFTPISNLAALGGASATQYPFRMTVRFGSAGGAPPSPFNKFVLFVTDPLNGNEVVGACYIGT